MKNSCTHVPTPPILHNTCEISYPLHLLPPRCIQPTQVECSCLLSFSFINLKMANENGYWVSSPGVKRPGHGVDHPPASGVEVKETVQLYLYSPSGSSWPVIAWPLPLYSRIQGAPLSCWGIYRRKTYEETQTYSSKQCVTNPPNTTTHPVT